MDADEQICCSESALISVDQRSFAANVRYTETSMHPWSPLMMKSSTCSVAPVACGRDELEYTNGLHAEANICKSRSPCACYEAAKILQRRIVAAVAREFEIRAIVRAVDYRPAVGGLPVAYGVCEALRAHQVCTGASVKMPPIPSVSAGIWSSKGEGCCWWTIFCAPAKSVNWLPGEIRRRR